MGAHARLTEFRSESGALASPTVTLAAGRQELLRFITCGSVDDGKSTLIGRLLYDSNTIPEDQLDALAADSKTFGTRAGGLDFALLVDGLAAEREQGITIDVAYRYFATSRRSFIVADTPGHEQYTRNMATGASTAELAIVLVDARKGILPQTRQHSLILSMLRVSQVVLAVNKMDLVGHSEAVFQAIETEYRRFAASLGFARIVCIPLSALLGENVRKRSMQMAWYAGPTLLDHLETVNIAPSAAHRPFRMAVQWVNRASPEFRGFSGMIASGEVRPGDAVCVMPSGEKARVARIVTYDGDLDRALAGQSVTLTLDRELDVSRGDVISEGFAPARASQRFEATVLWTGNERFHSGRPLLLKVGAATVPVRLPAEFESLEISTGERQPSKELATNTIARCLIRTDVPVVVEHYAESRALGGFILIDRVSGDTVALGMVEAIDHTEGAPVSVEAGAHRSGPVRAWFDTAADRPWRSLAKAVTWRATGSIDTFILAYLFTGSVKTSAALSTTELVTKVLLYYGHERVWARVGAGIRSIRGPLTGWRVRRRSFARLARD